MFERSVGAAFEFEISEVFMDQKRIIAKCSDCGHGHDFHMPRSKPLADISCDKCGGELRMADLRYCAACGTTVEDIHLAPPSYDGDVVDSVVIPNQEIPAVRIFVEPGTEKCPNGHPLHKIVRKTDE